MIRILAAAAAALLGTGCASIVNDTTHPMKLETRRTDGTMVTGADCQLTFGRTLVFDRYGEKEGQPVTGTEPVAAK